MCSVIILLSLLLWEVTKTFSTWCCSYSRFNICLLYFMKLWPKYLSDIGFKQLSNVIFFASHIIILWNVCTDVKLPSPTRVFAFHIDQENWIPSSSSSSLDNVLIIPYDIIIIGFDNHLLKCLLNDHHWEWQTNTVWEFLTAAWRIRLSYASWEKSQMSEREIPIWSLHPVKTLSLINPVGILPQTNHTTWLKPPSSKLNRQHLLNTYDVLQYDTNSPKTPGPLRGFPAVEHFHTKKKSCR